MVQRPDVLWTTKGTKNTNWLTQRRKDAKGGGSFLHLVLASLRLERSGREHSIRRALWVWALHWPRPNPDSDSILKTSRNMPARRGLECRGSRTATLAARVGIGIGIGIGIESEFEFEFEDGDPDPGKGDEDVAAPFHPGASSRCVRL